MSNPLAKLDQEIIDCRSNPKNLLSIFIDYSRIAGSFSREKKEKYAFDLNQLFDL